MLGVNYLLQNKEVFVPERDPVFFFLLDEGDDKWPYLLHDIRSEWIARWIQPAGGVDRSYDHLNSSFTCLSLLGELPIRAKNKLKQKLVSVPFISHKKSISQPIKLTQTQ